MSFVHKSITIVLGTATAIAHLGLSGANGLALAAGVVGNPTAAKVGASIADPYLDPEKSNLMGVSPYYEDIKTILISKAVEAESAAVAENDPQLSEKASICLPYLRGLSPLFSYYSTDYEVNDSNAQSRLQDLIAYRKTIPAPCILPTAIFLAAMAMDKLAHVEPGLFGTSEAAPLADILIQELYSSSHLALLTPEERLRRGISWQSRDRQGNYLIFAEYRCSDQDAVKAMIYFDPNLPPFDLAAALIHEMDHLFRDKLFDWQTVKLSARDQTLWSEWQATLEAGFYQASLALNHREPHYLKIFGMIYGETKQVSGFQSTRDFSLYTRKGRLFSLLRESRAKTNSFDGSYSSFISNWLLGDGKVEVASVAPIQESILGTLPLIQSVYFPGLSWSPELPVDLQSGKFSQAETSPLAQVAAHDWVPDSWGLKGYGQQGIADLELFQDRLEHSTQACRDFQAAVRSGELKGFIGAEIPTESGVEGSGPGVEGSGPGMRFAVPCMRPSEGF